MTNWKNALLVLIWAIVLFVPKTNNIQEKNNISNKVHFFFEIRFVSSTFVTYYRYIVYLYSENTVLILLFFLFFFPVLKGNNKTMDNIKLSAIFFF